MAKVAFERDGALAVVSLQSPPLNQIDEQLVGELHEAVERLERADDVRALLVRGEGDVFSAGADVKLFAGKSATDMRPLVAAFVELGQRIERLAFPTLAAVHGVCMAGGYELALFCDLIWAAEGTQMGLPEVTLGIVPLAGGVERVAARSGVGRARAMALGGRLHSAEELLGWGAVDRVLPGGQLHADAERYAHRLAAGPTAAMAAVKQLTRRFSEQAVPPADEILGTVAVGLFDSDDARAGIATFLESGPGKATFAGR